MIQVIEWFIVGEVVAQLKASEDIVFAAKWNPSGTRLLTVGSGNGDFSVINKIILGMEYRKLARNESRKGT